MVNCGVSPRNQVMGPSIALAMPFTRLLNPFVRGTSSAPILSTFCKEIGEFVGLEWWVSKSLVYGKQHPSGLFPNHREKGK